MFTDVVGYSSLAQRNEEHALSILEEHRRVIRPILVNHKGNEIKTIGDAFLVAFSSALDAVRCAYEIQEALRKDLAHSFSGFQIRIGIHLGDAVHSGGDLYGDAVNIASRIVTLAEAGGIAISRQVYDQVANKVNFSFSSLGMKNLKHIDNPIEVFKLTMSPRNTVIQEEATSNHARVAVMPMANLSPDPNDSYFADGMTEELISAISALKGLRVVSRTSSMSYRNTAKNLNEIAKELNVGSVVEGSVRKVGAKARISVQLIDGATDEYLWASTYDRELTDVFAIQSDVARQVAAALKIKIAVPEEAKISKNKTENVQAYQHYLMGVHFLFDREEESLRKALTNFELAAKLDPYFAEAIVGIAYSYELLGHHSHMPKKDSYELTKEFALKALKADPELSDPHIVLGDLLMVHDWNLREAEEEYRTSITLNPSGSRARRSYARCLAALGNLEEALHQATLAVELDPLDGTCLSEQGVMFMISGRDSEAIATWRKAIELYPDRDLLHFFITIFYLSRGKYDEAGRELSVLKQESFRNPLVKMLWGFYCGVKGNVKEASRIASELIELYTRGHSTADLVSFVYAGLGDDLEFFNWLGKAIAARDVEAYILKNYKAFYPEKLASDRRWKELLEKAGLM